MLVAVEKLVEFALTGGLGSKHIGNHWCQRQAAGYWKFFYYNTCICAIDTDKLLVMFDNGGYHTSSTTRAVNSYREAFTGFHEISVAEFKDRMRRYELL